MAFNPTAATRILSHVRGNAQHAINMMSHATHPTALNTILHDLAPEIRSGAISPHHISERLWKLAESHPDISRNLFGGKTDLTRTALRADANISSEINQLASDVHNHLTGGSVDVSKLFSHAPAAEKTYGYVPFWPWAKELPAGTTGLSAKQVAARPNWYQKYWQGHTEDSLALAREAKGEIAEAIDASRGEYALQKVQLENKVKLEKAETRLRQKYGLEKKPMGLAKKAVIGGGVAAGGVLGYNALTGGAANNGGLMAQAESEGAQAAIRDAMSQGYGPVMMGAPTTQITAANYNGRMSDGMALGRA